MKIGIVGSGLMGSALGQAWARAGHSILYSYSRSREKLDALARRSGAGARAATVREAADEGDAVLIAVRWPTLDEVIEEAGPLDGKVVITCSLPMTDDDSELRIGHVTSGAEELARRLPGARVIAAFNTVPSELITAIVDGNGPAERPAVVFCGDDDEAKATAAALIRDAGFDPVDAGGLRVARYMEPFGLLVGELAYSRGPTPELGYRFVTAAAGKERG